MDKLFDYLIEEIEQSELDEIQRSELFEKIKKNKDYLANLGATCAIGWLRIMILIAKKQSNGVFKISFSFEDEKEPDFIWTLSTILDNLEDGQLIFYFGKLSKKVNDFIKKKCNVLIFVERVSSQEEDEETILRSLFRDFK